MKPRFREVCRLEADLSGLKRSLVAQRNPTTGISYYTVDFTVAVLFGGTTLKARLRWFENVSVDPNNPPSVTKLIDIRANYVKVQ